MKTLRTITTVLFMAIASISMAQEMSNVQVAYEQVYLSTSRLNGTKWRIKGSTSGSVYEYTTSQRIWHHKDGSLSTYPYYFTNTPITSYEYSAFDYSKVGKNTRGMYIVSLNTKAKVVYCAKIQSFDKTKGVFITKLVTEGLIGVGDGISTYEMVK